MSDVTVANASRFVNDPIADFSHLPEYGQCPSQSSALSMRVGSRKFADLSAQETASFLVRCPLPA
jgi:hypothetical protein